MYVGIPVKGCHITDLLIILPTLLVWKFPACFEVTIYISCDCVQNIICIEISVAIYHDKGPIFSSNHKKVL